MEFLSVAVVQLVFVTVKPAIFGRLIDATIQDDHDNALKSEIKAFINMIGLDSERAIKYICKSSNADKNRNDGEPGKL